MATLEHIKYEELTLCVDFGTTNSVVSFYDDDKDEVVFINFDGKDVFPSAILFSNDNNFVVDEKTNTKYNDEISFVCGLEAKNASIIYPESSILSVKSLLGVKDTIKVNLENISYLFKPEQIVGFILEDIRIRSNEFIQSQLKINRQFTKIVITVPANSSDKQKKKTKDACILAGFDEDNIFLRLEPSAGAIVYAKRAVKDEKVLIYDFGGGTFDACLLNIEIDNKKPVVSIINTQGDNNLGGNNIDSIILDIIYEEFKNITDNKIDLFDDDFLIINKRQKKIALARLMQSANNVKEKLSKSSSARVSLTPLITSPNIVNINMTITREQFLSHKRVNMLSDDKNIFDKFYGKSLEDIINMTISEIDSCLSDVNINKNDVNEVFLVGGSSQIPIVAEKLTKYFGKQPYRTKLNTAKAISEGASYYSKMINDPECNILKYIETTVHSLGIELIGRRYLEIIKPNTFIPIEGLTVVMEEPITTSFDFVNKMVIGIYEYTKISDKNIVLVNEKGMTRLCGTTLNGIPQREKGLESVIVSFTIKRDNILTVTARSCSNAGVFTELYIDELY